jgi:hypothetical protein
MKGRRTRRFPKTHEEEAMNIQITLPVASNIQSAGSRAPRLTGMHAMMDSEVRCDASLHADVIDRMLSSLDETIEVTFTADKMSHAENGFLITATAMLP